MLSGFCDRIVGGSIVHEIESIIRFLLQNLGISLLKFLIKPISYLVPRPLLASISRLLLYNLRRGLLNHLMGILPQSSEIGPLLRFFLTGLLLGLLLTISFRLLL